MDSKEFPVVGTIRKAFETYKGNLALYLGLAMLSISIVAFTWVADSLLGIQFFTFIGSAFVALGLTVTAVRTFKGIDTEFGDFFGVYQVYPLYLVSSFIAYFAVGTAAVLFAVMLFAVFVVMQSPLYIKIATVAVGTIPLLAPGLYIATRIQFYGFIIAEADKRSGSLVYESLERSWEITKGRSFDILLMDLALFAMNVLAIALCVAGVFVAIPLTIIGLIGLLLTIPVSILALMHTYVALRGEVEAVEQANAETE